MADFLKAYEATMANEGGYVLHEVAGDKGGQTFAGIARKFHAEWPGWKLIDRGITSDITLTELVREFYRTKFWDAIRGDDITDQRVADGFYDTAVNMGVVIGTKHVQVKGSDVFDERLFCIKAARRLAVVRKDRSQIKFLLGWLSRDLRAVS